jgi:hypothetical protein
MVFNMNCFVFLLCNFDPVIYQRLDILVKDEKEMCLNIDRVCAELCNKLLEK